MKRLITKLPNDIKYKINEANNNLTKREILNGIELLFDVIDAILNELDEEILSSINMGFLQFMKVRINKLKCISNIN